MNPVRIPGARSLGALVAAILLVILAFSCLAIIPAGHVGVVDLFGKVSDRALKPGINLKNPFARVVRMSVKTQEMKEVMQVPSKEGLSVQLEVSVLFHLNPEKAADVYRTVGPTYPAVLLEPNFRSITRGVTASYDARALYTTEREQLGRDIQAQLERTIGPRGIEIEATPLRKVDLPAKLTAAIEEKLQAEQESQRMQFVLQKETQEAERKRIEAQGIADFQAIVSRGLSDPFLRWKGIEATEKLAGSPNAKVVVVGSGKDGLPLILGGN
jgi:regulator of protease activity HflC (stomatin/prohibitin superfamily)